MESKVFNEIMENLNKRVQWCDEHLGPLTSKEGIEALTVGEYLKIKEQCKKYHSEMDKIFCEVRHLICMGDMTVVQQSRFLSLLKRFTDYRPDIKHIDSHKDANSLPDIPASTQYTLSILSNITLKKEARGKEVVVDDETPLENTVKDPIRNNKQTYNIEYSNSNKSIIITYDPNNEEELESIVESFNEVLGTSKSKLKKNLKTATNHYNIGFTFIEDGKIQFRLLLSDAKNLKSDKGKITKYFKDIIEGN